MTTKPSSSPRSSITKSRTLHDAISQPVKLGDEVGRGGEGSVFEVDGNPSLVVKVYHKTPLPEELVAKLRVMSSIWTADLERIAAWPRTILFDPVHRKPVGLLMSKMEGARQLHELYGTTNRRRHFPDAGWHHLVLAARNAAAAFNTLHAAKIVVGDVNQGNLLVDEKMCVRMIDCDSFQIERDGETYNCPVGSPHFTPPELQGQRLRDVARTVDHDCFGLATLIFHLLFVGRHPYAGRPRGLTDLSIEKAIAEHRFAFSRNRAATQVDPPPASLLLDDLPPSIGNLFELAFRPTGQGRPRPQQWIQELELLIKQRRACDIDPMHIYAPEAGRCPWCRIEDIGGPSFFIPADVPSNVASLRLARLDDTVANLPEVHFPMVPAERYAVPAVPKLKKVRPLPQRTPRDHAAAVLAASWMVAIVGAFAFVSPVVCGVGAGLSVAAAGYLLVDKSSRGSRAQVHKYKQRLAKQAETIRVKGRKIDIQHRTRFTDFEESQRELEEERHNYRAEGDELVSVIINSRHSQLDDYLRNLSIRDSVTMIAGMTLNQVTLLESFGVETAFDCERIKLYGIPSIDESTSINLVHWRAEMERRFRFNPEHGISLDNLNSIGDATVRRFKMLQARKVLMCDERLKMLVENGKDELVMALTPFDADVRHFRKIAAELCEYQQARRPLERLVNRSWWTLAVPTLAFVALAALLFYAG
jgi:DNA-binding helix-hairpin-helix protein with protein kinase domain